MLYNPLSTILQEAQRISTGDPNHRIGQIQDITTHKRSEERLQHMATHDPLTVVPTQA